MKALVPKLKLESSSKSDRPPVQLSSSSSLGDSQDEDKSSSSRSTTRRSLSPKPKRMSTRRVRSQASASPRHLSPKSERQQPEVPKILSLTAPTKTLKVRQATASPRILPSASPGQGVPTTARETPKVGTNILEGTASDEIVSKFLEGVRKKRSLPRRPVGRRLRPPRLPRLSIQETQEKDSSDEVVLDAAVITNRRLVQDSGVFEKLREYLFHNVDLPKADNLALANADVTVPMSRSAIVSELWSEMLSKPRLYSRHLLKLLRHLIRDILDDPAGLWLMSEAFEHFEEMKDAYFWAITAFVFDNRGQSNRVQGWRKVQVLSETLLKCQRYLTRFSFSTLPLGARLVAMKSPFKPLSDEWDFRKRIGLLSESPLWTWESLPPFRVTSGKVSILPGTSVISEKVLAISPCMHDADDDSWSTLCFFCLGDFSLLDLGYSCPVMPRTCPFRFCSFDCLTRNGLLHQYSCQFVHTQLFPLAHSTGFKPGFILLLVRLLIRSYVSRHSNTKMDDPLLQIAKVSSTETETRRLRPELYEALRLLSGSLCHYFPISRLVLLSPEDMDDLVCRIHTVAVPIAVRSAARVLQGDLDPVCEGFVLVEQISHVLHSCIPNMSVKYDAVTATVTTLASTPIEPHVPLSISFLTDLYAPSSVRKNLWASWKVIQCCCGRCEDASEGSRFVGGIRCPQCLFSYCAERRRPRLNLLLTRKLDESAIVSNFSGPVAWECEQCGILPTKEGVVAANKTQQWVTKYDALVAKYKDSVPVQRRNYEDLLSEIIKTAHPFHWLLYHLNIRLGTLWAANPARSFYKALEHFRMAEIAVRSVLPLASNELMVVSLKRASVTFNCLMQLKLTKHPNSTTVDEHEVLLMEPIWRALWCAYCLCGNTSVEWLYCHQAVKKYALLTRCGGGMSTSALHVGGCWTFGKISIPDPQKLVRAYVRVWPGNGVPSEESVTSLAHKDPLAWWFGACRIGDVEVIKGYVQSMGWSPSIFSEVDVGFGYNGLGITAKFGHLEAFRYILARSPLESLTLRNGWGQTLLMYICLVPEDVAAQMISTLLSRLRELGVGEVNLARFITTESNDYSGNFQAIHYATARKNLNCVRTLISWEPKVVAATNKELATPLHLACMVGCSVIAEFLCRHNNIQVDSLNYRGETPLMMACYVIQPTTCRLLLNAGAKEDHVTETFGTTCLHSLVSGVTRTFGVAFGAELDQGNLDLHLDGIESFKGVTHPPTYASIPAIEALPDDLVLYPEKLDGRLNDAITIVENIRANRYRNNVVSTKVQPQPLQPPTAELTGNDDIERLFAHSCKDGFTAAELLLHQWDVLQEVRNSLLTSATCVKLANAPINDRAKYLETWIHQVSLKVAHLVNLLKPCSPKTPTTMRLRMLTGLGERQVMGSTPPNHRTNAAGQIYDSDMQTLFENTNKPWQAQKSIFPTAEDKLNEEKEAMLKETLKLTEELRLDTQKLVLETRKAAANSPSPKLATKPVKSVQPVSPSSNGPLPKLATKPVKSVQPVSPSPNGPPPKLAVATKPPTPPPKKP